MRLDRVTITGADDQTPVSEMLKISEQFPFVEWGILSSESSNGDPRFPSNDWVDRLLTSAEGRLKLSLHLCGRWVRQLLLGRNDLPGDGIARDFQRVQLNFHAEKTPCTPRDFFAALRSIDEQSIKRQWIFQHDGASGNDYMDSLLAEFWNTTSVDTVALFDVSGGAGIVPKDWPEPEYVDHQDIDADRDHYGYHGYAGGLGPENVMDELARIRRVVDKVDRDCRIWIDMETHVRTDEVLDLAKVRAVLEACRGSIWEKK